MLARQSARNSRLGRQTVACWASRMPSSATAQPAVQPLAPPAQLGMAVHEVDTPALLLDLDAFERNLARLPRSLGEPKVRIRAHAKSHKCPEIAKRQVAHG